MFKTKKVKKNKYHRYHALREKKQKNRVGVNLVYIPFFGNLSFA